jgi:hypothetical protein
MTRTIATALHQDLVLALHRHCCNTGATLLRMLAETNTVLHFTEACDEAGFYHGMSFHPH